MSRDMSEARTEGPIAAGRAWNLQKNDTNTGRDRGTNTARSVFCGRRFIDWTTEACENLHTRYEILLSTMGLLQVEAIDIERGSILTHPETTNQIRFIIFTISVLDTSKLDCSESASKMRGCPGMEGKTRSILYIEGSIFLYIENFRYDIPTIKKSIFRYIEKLRWDTTKVRYSDVSKAFDTISRKFDIPIFRKKASALLKIRNFFKLSTPRIDCRSALYYLDISGQIDSWFVWSSSWCRTEAA